MEKIRQKWHEAVNHFHKGKHGPDFRHWMYEAMEAHGEVKRLERVFALERKRELPMVHRQCSYSQPVPLAANFLTCCLGVKCCKCSELKSLDSAELSPKEIDTAKAWTCVAHILSEGGDSAREGYVLDETDKMYWANAHESLAKEEDSP